MQRLNGSQWLNVFRNTQEANEEIEVTWLDGTDEWVLNVGCELLEDGFKTEKEAYDRLYSMENRYYTEEK